MKAKEKAKVKDCDTCRLHFSKFCRECYDFGLFTPKEVRLDLFVSTPL